MNPETVIFPKTRIQFFLNPILKFFIYWLAMFYVIIIFGTKYVIKYYLQKI